MPVSKQDVEISNQEFKNDHEPIPFNFTPVFPYISSLARRRGMSLPLRSVYLALIKFIGRYNALVVLPCSCI